MFIMVIEGVSRLASYSWSKVVELCIRLLCGQGQDKIRFWSNGNPTNACRPGVTTGYNSPTDPPVGLARVLGVNILSEAHSFSICPWIDPSLGAGSPRKRKEPLCDARFIPHFSLGHPLVSDAIQRWLAYNTHGFAGLSCVLTSWSPKVYRMEEQNLKRNPAPQILFAQLLSLFSNNSRLRICKSAWKAS